MAEIGRLSKAKILIVDDVEPNVVLLTELLRRSGYQEIVGATDARKGLDLCRQVEPDLIILDLLMPDLDGFGFMTEAAKFVPEDTYLPILVITADTTREARQRALTMGAKDFLTKPFEATEVLLRVRNLLETRFLHERLRARNASLEALVEQRTLELSRQVAALDVLAKERLALLSKLSETTAPSPEEEDLA